MLEALPGGNQVFSVLQLFEIIYSHSVFTGRLSTHLDSTFTKNPVSTLPNTLAARIFMKVEIGN